MEDKKIVYIAGCFDLIHNGHINIIKKAKQLGDYLVVGVNSNDFIYSYKKKFPVIDEKDRLTMIRALKYDYIHIFKPRYIVHGSDWRGNELLKQMNITQEMIDKYNIEMKIFDYTPGVSTTSIRNTLSNN